MIYQLLQEFLKNTLSKTGRICLGCFVLIGFSFSFQTEVGVLLAKAAEERTLHQVQYDPSYFSIAYPNGDVPADKGVCTDVVIRSMRGVGIDLQLLVHRDMEAHFSEYPSIWGLKKTDTNIDHRRVPNLMTYFQRKEFGLSLDTNALNYLPGDIVCWNLGSRNDFYGTTHIGIVSSKKSASGVPLMVHNIGAGPKLENCLFDFTIIGHYRIP